MTSLQPYRPIENMKIWLIKHIQVKAGKKSSYIRSCVILPSKKLVFADENNQRLIIYRHDGHHHFDLIVSGKPFDIEAIDMNKVVVSYGIAKYIEIIDLEERKIETRIKLEGFCSGLSFIDGKIFVLVHGLGIQTADISQQTTTTFGAPPIDKSFFLTSSPIGIYYIDLQTNSLCCCSMSGNLLWKFSSSLLDGSQTITADIYGNVIVAATQANQIIAISRDGKHIRKLLDDKQGTVFPSALYYDKLDKCLLVCNRENGQAFMYNLM